MPLWSLCGTSTAHIDACAYKMPSCLTNQNNKFADRENNTLPSSSRWRITGHKLELFQRDISAGNEHISSCKLYNYPRLDFAQKSKSPGGRVQSIRGALINNLFMRQRAYVAILSTRKVWKAPKGRKSCSRSSRAIEFS